MAVPHTVESATDPTTRELEDSVEKADEFRHLAIFPPGVDSVEFVGFGQPGRWVRVPIKPGERVCPDCKRRLGR